MRIGRPTLSGTFPHDSKEIGRSRGSLLSQICDYSEWLKVWGVIDIFFPEVLCVQKNTWEIFKGYNLKMEVDC